MYTSTLKVVAKSNCAGRDCPTIYRKDEDTVVIQGYKADDLFLTDLPEGEQAVMIPVSLLRDLAI
jgi:hypothetical protein